MSNLYCLPGRAGGSPGYARPIPEHRIGSNRKADVFQVLLAQIGEFNADLALDVIVRRRRDADTTWFCDALKARRNVNAIAKDVVGLDNHVADIDADTESNTPVFRLSGRKLIDAGLKLYSGSNRFDRARKFGQESIPSVLHDAAAMFGSRSSPNSSSLRKYNNPALRKASGLFSPALNKFEI
jgi:hypothetical protein